MSARGSSGSECLGGNIIVGKRLSFFQSGRLGGGTAKVSKQYQRKSRSQKSWQDPPCFERHRRCLQASIKAVDCPSDPLQHSIGGIGRFLREMEGWATQR